MNTSFAGVRRLGKIDHPSAWLISSLKERYLLVFLESLKRQPAECWKTAYETACVLHGVDMNGGHSVLSAWKVQSEYRQTWQTMLLDLQDRGVESILLFCADRMKGLEKALSSQYPDARFQRNVLSVLGASVCRAPFTKSSDLQDDLMAICTAASEHDALAVLASLKAKWGVPYSACFTAWLDNWNDMSSFYSYPSEIQNALLSANVANNLNTKAGAEFYGTGLNDDALCQLLKAVNSSIGSQTISGISVIAKRLQGNAYLGEEY